MHDDFRLECCVAAAALILNTMDSSPGATKPELMGILTCVILEAMGACEREARFRREFLPSAN